MSRAGCQTQGGLRTTEPEGAVGDAMRCRRRSRRKLQSVCGSANNIVVVAEAYYIHTSSIAVSIRFT